MRELRPRLKGKRKAAFENITKDERRILIIGDLHLPFCIDGYLLMDRDWETLCIVFSNAFVMLE